MDPRTAWRNTTRSGRLPPNWATLRKETRRRAKGQCQATTHAPGCNGQGSECDHIQPGDNHSPENLQWLSHECHDAKTRADNANANRARAQQRQRPTEPHPGAIPQTR